MVEEEEGEGPAAGLGCSLERFREVSQMDEWISGLKRVSEDEKKTELLLEKVSTVLDYYQEQPRMLDPHLPGWLERLLAVVMDSDDRHGHAAAAVAQHLIKVRGYKMTLRHFPHDVGHVEPVLRLLEKQDPSWNVLWETKNVLLLWMSILVLVPFHLSRFETRLAERLFDVCKKYSGGAKKSAAFMTGKFLTRPEVVQEAYLSKFLDWVNATVHDEAATEQAKTGALMAAAASFKFGSRHDLIEHAPSGLRLATALQSHEVVSVRKAAVKLCQRVGLTFLKARLVSWRYQRGSRSLALNLGGGAASVPEAEDEGDDDGCDVPDGTEEVIEHLLTGLRSPETIVRWSAAKGVGRVTSRLPKDLADDVVASLLQLFTLRESDAAWHGGCLALAELCRRGLLLPSRLPDVVAVVEKASVYDERRGNFSVGSHVRDAACYVCWSLARAFDAATMAPAFARLAGCLLTVALFDREVNCRRAASAAFQENVGRQGADCLPSAIDILTTVDYHSVGSRIACYEALSVSVSRLSTEAFAETLVRHLLEKKVGHWDAAIRELAAKALRRFCAVVPGVMAGHALPRLLDAVETAKDLHLRHGAILGVGQLVLGLSGGAADIGEPAARRIREMVSGLESRMALRGYGGELVRQALTEFVHDASLADAFPCARDDPAVDLWRMVVDDNLANPSTQERAIAASTALVRRFGDGDVVDRYMERMLSPANEATRRGFCLALGSLPDFALAGWLDEVLPAVMRCTRKKAGEESWAEGRRDAVRSLTSIVTTFGVRCSGSGVLNAVPVYECYLDAMDDYSMDRRGDVGAWVREAAMSGLEAVTEAASPDPPRVCVERTAAKLAQQAVEKIDRTRGLAAKAFASLLATVESVPRRRELLGFFPPTDRIGWTVESETFPVFARLLRLDEYRDRVLLGMIVSVGGMTESLVAHSSSALWLQIERMEGEELAGFCASVVRVVEDNRGAERLAMPSMKFMERLLNSGRIEAVLADPASPFAMSAFALVKREAAGCCDPNRVMAAADVLCALLQAADGAARRRCLVQLGIFLCHRFPRVRKATAAKLFEALLVLSLENVGEADLDEVNALLADTAWDHGSVEGALRPARNRICELLGVPPPAVLKKPVV